MMTNRKCSSVPHFGEGEGDDVVVVVVNANITVTYMVCSLLPTICCVKVAVQLAITKSSNRDG